MEEDLEQEKDSESPSAHRPDLAPSPPAIIWGHFVVVQEVHSPLELWRLSSHACGQAVQAEFPKDDRLKKQPQKEWSSGPANMGTLTCASFKDLLAVKSGKDDKLWAGSVRNDLHSLSKPGGGPVDPTRTETPNSDSNVGGSIPPLSISFWLRLQARSPILRSGWWVGATARARPQ
ncbi:hypothetical protein RHOSPDRAFT_27941 [Rhodotorula sp. JG-1b]|nr:hypothetical protein RHOSPDRAFT_27941 [Rhodotorula sp. JG-1b]